MSLETDIQTLEETVDLIKGNFHKAGLEIQQLQKSIADLKQKLAELQASGPEGEIRNVVTQINDLEDEIKYFQDIKQNLMVMIGPAMGGLKTLKAQKEAAERAAQTTSAAPEQPAVSFDY